jgi:hypothetical protein
MSGVEEGIGVGRGSDLQVRQLMRADGMPIAIMTVEIVSMPWRYTEWGMHYLRNLTPR